jgi:hypothetical protein
MVEPITTAAGIAAIAASILLSLKTGFETYLEIMKSLKQLTGGMEIPGWDKLEQINLEAIVELDAMLARLKQIPQTPA